MWPLQNHSVIQMIIETELEFRQQILCLILCVVVIKANMFIECKSYQKKNNNSINNYVFMRKNISRLELDNF